MRSFELAQPASLQEAIALLDTDDDSVRPIAGGTALMLMMKAGVFRPRRLVSLRRLGNDFLRIAPQPNGELAIGAMVPLAGLERSHAVARHAPVVTRSMRRLSNVRVRNVATVGGNLAHGDPHMDLPPILIALAASVSVAGSNGQRRIPLEDFFTGYFETALQKNEMIVALCIPPQGSAWAEYVKVTTGSAEDWPALGLAVSVEADETGIRSARIVVSAATEKAVRLRAAEQCLCGTALDEKTLRRAGETAADEVECISDLRGSATYKRELVRVHVQRALQAGLGRAGTTH
jgi:carbon-monoxide dehydrogenase medium subunit